MQRYNNTSLAFAEDTAYADGFEKIEEYLSAEDGYWLNEDVWEVNSGKFEERRIDLSGRKKGNIADFTMIRSYTIRTELKYCILKILTEKTIKAAIFSSSYKSVLTDLSDLLTEKAHCGSLAGVMIEDDDLARVINKTRKRAYARSLLNNIERLLVRVYGPGDETKRDIWRPKRIPGVRLSATQMRTAGPMHFEDIPEHYRECIKRYMKRLVIKRSWTHCSEMLRYIRNFFRLFYENGYEDGFLETLSRYDIENYLEWAAAEYEETNATYASKSVSFVRQFLDYIQMAEYPQAPKKDIYRLIFDEDIPRRERPADTFEKIRYIPEPVLVQLDANVSAIEPSEMQPLYILLRETGWRGTDVLNLRYDKCLDYVWNKADGKYIPYLCGEITKTGIPMLKIPIRDDVAAMLEDLIKDAKARSTAANNPHGYLFNTYKGSNMGLPYSRADFAAAVQDMINRKAIRDADDSIYHFKVHALRHTRATEYAEQGMPIGVIQKLLGHCSLQMTLHYAKVSEDTVYRKWKESTDLGSLHLGVMPPGVSAGTEADTVHYEKVNKSLDAVKVPFGVCFKPSKLACRTQLKHCLECANFCSSHENEAEYRDEIRRVDELIAIAKRLGREEWIEKNEEYLQLLLATQDRIAAEGVVHKNGAMREVSDA